MAKKPTKTALKKKADTLFSLYIRARDGMCQRCGSSDRLQCAHGFSRRYLGTRWDEENAWALCAGCHVYWTHRPLEWDETMLLWLGVDRYAALRKRALTITQPDYDLVIAELTEKLKEAA